MKKINIETTVGIFLIIGLLCMAYLSTRLGGVNLFGTDQYPIKAQFSNISGLREGATVEIAGVTVGKVSKIQLDDYEASVELLIDPEVAIQEDSIASIRTQGIIGDKYIKINPGGAEEYIKPGGEIFETEPTIDLEELVGKYIFDSE